MKNGQKYIQTCSKQSNHTIYQQTSASNMAKLLPTTSSRRAPVMYPALAYSARRKRKLSPVTTPIEA